MTIDEPWWIKFVAILLAVALGVMVGWDWGAGAARVKLGQHFVTTTCPTCGQEWSRWEPASP